MFNDYSEMVGNSEPENILIVASETRPEDFGAERVVKGMNGIYYLQYKTASERNEALKKLREDDSLLAVPNITLGITIGLDEDEYMSWGIKKMGLNKMMEAISENDEPESLLAAVIDTGVKPAVFSEKFPDRNLTNYCVVACENGMDDIVGHGTHVIGTVTEGTANNVDLLMIRVGETASFPVSNLITSIDYAVAQGANVINISAGAAFDFNSQEWNEEYQMTWGEIYQQVWDIEKQSIDAAFDAGAIIVASAGNEGRPDSINYPASYEKVMSIGAVDSNYNIASFSNYNEYVDFVAPGSAIGSLNYGYTGEPGQSIILLNQGTSMAAPHVSAAVADILSFNKELAFDEVKEVLRSKAIDLGDEGKDDYFGYGFVDFSDAEFCLNGMLCDDYGVFLDLEKLVNYSDAEVAINGDGFNVTNEEACMVVGLKDDEYSQVRAEAGEVVDGVTTKVYDVSGFDEVMVLLKGDGDLDGEVTSSDSSTINRSLISSTLRPFRPLSDLEKVVYDLDGDGEVTSSDSSTINRSLISPTLRPYYAIEW